MNIIEQERALIEARLLEIKNNKETAMGNREIIIAGGDPVLRSDGEEYAALKAMLDILNNNLVQSSKFEYLENREKTNIPRLLGSASNIFINPEDQRKKERLAIKERMDNLQKLGNVMDDTPKSVASDGKTVVNVEEYETLLKMNDIASNDFKTDFDKYPMMRAKTSLGPIDDTSYEVMTGKKLSKPVEIEQSEKQEETALATPAEVQDIEEVIVPNADIEVISSPTDDLDDDKIIDAEFSEVKDDEEGLIEVEKVTPWKWIKDHKKEILIALGIAALTVTTIIAISELLPAIMASVKTSQVAGIAAEMVTNGDMWFAASASEKLALHGANTALADVVTSLTGAKNVFDTASGVWTIGAETLPQFANSAITAAGLAASKVSLLTNITALGSIGGLGALGAGLVIPKKKSKEYYNIKGMIDSYVDTAYDISKEDSTKTAQMISNKIIASSRLSDNERDILLRKLQKTIKKVNKITASLENQNEVNDYLQDENEVIQDVEFRDVFEELPAISL